MPALRRSMTVVRLASSSSSSPPIVHYNWLTEWVSGRLDADWYSQIESAALGQIVSWCVDSLLSICRSAAPPESVSQSLLIETFGCVEQILFYLHRGTLVWVQWNVFNLIDYPIQQYGWIDGQFRALNEYLIAVRSLPMDWWASTNWVSV